MNRDREDILKSLDETFLTQPTHVPRHWVKDFQHVWEYQLDLRRLLHVETSNPSTTLELKTSGLSGQITGYEEVTRNVNRTTDAKSSSSLTRAPTEHSSFIRGKSSYVPFAPAGLASEEPSELEDIEDVVERMERGLELSFGGIQTIPPGFTRGLDFDAEQDGDFFDSSEQQVTPVYRPSLARSDAIADGSTSSSKHQVKGPQLHAEVAQLLPEPGSQEALAYSNRPSTTAHKKKKPAIAKRDWAHVIDVNQELKNFDQLVPNMAKTYPFELDTFQKEAVYHMEQGDSVFVAAHTSAGKTVVAEYAIALAIKHMTRAIYTSPIKALSNQKFRDFKDTFGLENVGILTGDVQINPEASCLIMTTEILRSMLYKGADLIRDIEWVIFDEVHYVNDLERGVVWEEVIIMLPEHVGLILLSATVPNTKEFANWVGRTQQKDIYVISTPKRPVPLEHFLYAGKEMHQILNTRGEFQEKGIKSAHDALKRKQEKEREAAGLPPVSARGARGVATGRGRGSASAGTFTRARGGARTMAQQDRNLWIHLVGLLRKKELLPVVVFTFSKKKCEEHAGSMPNTDLCTASEKSEIHLVIEKSLVRLKGPDRTLPQIRHMRQLLSRGIGVHHGGMLPIVKEMVEILFQRGLVKVLFATETFAMGVNMPARSVVFSGLRKHDGRSFRELLPGEYTQMSGRAGRRGLDATGVVLIVCDGEVPETSALHKVLLGSATRLTSQFRLTYNMILNLLRVEALRVEDMIRRSFSENAAQRLLPDQQKQVNEIERQLSKLPNLEDEPHVDQIRQFYNLNRELVSCQKQVISSISSGVLAGKVLTPGRIVIVRDETYEHNLGIILRTGAPQINEDAFATSSIVKTYLVCVLGHANPCTKVRAPKWPVTPDATTTTTALDQMNMSTLPVTSLSTITKHSLKTDVSALLDQRKSEAIELVKAELQTLQKRDDFLQEVDLLKLKDLDTRQAINSRNILSSQQKQMNVVQDEHFDRIYETLHAEQLLKDQISRLRLALSDENLELLPDYQARVAVLQELNFVDDNSTVLLKGRVACEINSVNELILTELILENTFATFDPPEIVALLSAMVFRERVDDEPVLTDNLERGRQLLVAITNKVNDIQSKHRTDALGEGSNTELRFGLMEVVYEWARGMPFEQITELTQVQEGTIVHAITRLDETCREVRDAARVIGDATLYGKMETCRELIKRDIVFCASLYL